MTKDRHLSKGALFIYKTYLLRKKNRQQLSLQELAFLALLNKGNQTEELDFLRTINTDVVPNFKELDLSGLILKKAKLSGEDLAGVNLTLADLTEADLKGANLQKTVLKNAELCSANLTEADLSGANLSRVISKHLPVILEKAKLTGADLTEAGLKGARLRKADLTDADLTNADLKDADLSEANLTGIIEASISLSKIFKKGEDELFRNYFSPQNILYILNRLDDAQLKQTLFGKDKNVPASKYLENLINDINNPKLMKNLYTADNRPIVVLYELQKVLDCVKSHEERIKSTPSTNPQPTGGVATTANKAPESR